VTKDAKNDNAEEKKAEDKSQQDSWDALMGRLDKITESLRKASSSKDEEASEGTDAAEQEKK
jgi:hypothetical protein